MERFKITEKKLAQAVSFIKTGKGAAPKFAVKFKDDLNIKGKKLYYKNREVIPREKIDDVLRQELFGKKSDVPTGRDSAFHILKQRYVGLPKNKIMEFIRKQKSLNQVKDALPKPKKSAGKKLKTYTFETDLIFLKKKDLEKANKKFIKDDTEDLTYFLTCCEKVTGLSNFMYVKTKNQSVISPLVVKQCQKIAKQIGTNIKQCIINMDSGGEFSLDLFKKKFQFAETVKLAPSVENKNKHFQQNFFKILRQRKADTIKDAMQQAEVLMNNTYNKNHKATPNEVAKQDGTKSIAKFNQSRQTYQAGDKRKDFDIGQHVRLMIKEKKDGIDYKTYKNKTYSKEVYKISKKTKKSNPTKYRVGNKWYLQPDLLKSAPVDKVSEELVKSRTKENITKAKKAAITHTDKRVEEIYKQETTKRPRRKAALKAKLRMTRQKEKYDEIDEELEVVEDNNNKLKNNKKATSESYKKAKQLAEKNNIQKYINFLKKHDRPIGGTDKDIEYRYLALQRQLRRKKLRKEKKTLKV